MLGKFINDGKSYEINTPRTPKAWYNYFANQDYYMEFSQTGQGSSSALSPLTRAINHGYRYFYIVNHDDGTCYNPNYVPMCVESDLYSCIHHLGYSEIKSVKNGISVNIKAFVPTEGKYEVWTAEVENRSEQKRDISLLAAFSFHLTNPVMGEKCEYRKDLSAICGYTFPYHVKYEEYEKFKHRDNYIYLYFDREPDSFECGEPRFFNSQCHGDTPIPALNGHCSNKDSVMDRSLGAPMYRMELAPGEKRVFTFVQGCAKSASEIEAVKMKFKDGAEDELAKTREYWDQIGQNVHIETPDPELDHLINHWEPKQIAVMNKTHRFGMLSCVRNELQDAMGLSVNDSRQGALYAEKVLRQQLENGYLKQWHIIDDLLPPFSLALLEHKDGPVWLILCVSIITHQMGDINWLHTVVPYKNGGQGTIYAHLRKAAEYLRSQRGAHGLLLFGDGDWTDPINGMGKDGRGESTWTTLAFSYALRELAALSRMLKETADEKEFLALSDELNLAVNTHCWDGSWYIMGYADDGSKVGTSGDQEGQVFLNAQTWAVMSGAATGDRLVQCMKTIGMLDTDCGPRVCFPPYTGWNTYVGKASVKSAGTSENGSVYCHASMFKAYADCITGNPDAAYETVMKTLPSNQKNLHGKGTQSPIFLPNYYFGVPDSDNFGISSNNNSTGTAAWLQWVVTEHILGVKATAEGVKIQPNLPSCWQNAKIVRKVNGVSYQVEYEREAGEIKTKLSKP